MFNENFATSVHISGSESKKCVAGEKIVLAKREQNKHIEAVGERCTEGSETLTEAEKQSKWQWAGINAHPKKSASPPQISGKAGEVAHKLFGH